MFCRCSLLFGTPERAEYSEKDTKFAGAACQMLAGMFYAWGVDVQIWTQHLVSCPQIFTPTANMAEICVLRTPKLFSWRLISREKS